VKRIVILILTIFCTALSLAAQDSTTAGDQGKGKPMTGWICSSSCVVQQSEKATCDQSCTKSGNPVFVDENGSVMKISKKADKMAKKNMGKHVKVMATMDDADEIQRLQLLSTY
jgi:hypothetical protein